MLYLSSNHFSVDDQTADVISYLSNHPSTSTGMEEKFNSEFPEYNSLVWNGSWVDAESSNVDPEYMNWVRDWIEQNTEVTWEYGEPVIYEASDFDSVNEGFTIASAGILRDGEITIVWEI